MRSHVLLPRAKARFWWLPFCAGKCDYCAFYSEPAPDASLVRLWLDRVLLQLEENAPHLRTAETVYFGGGTPSLLPDDVLKRLFSAVREAVPHAAEISVEANPFTVTPEKAAVLEAMTTGFPSKRLRRARTPAISSCHCEAG